MYYKDRVCLVTGAASGIGKELSRELAEAGAKVIALDLNADMLQQWVNRIGGQSSISHQALDVTDHEAFRRVIEDTVAEHGRIDYLFNIAGISIAGEARDLDLEHWKKIIDVNLNGVVYGSTLAYKQMVTQGFGHIVNMASVQGLIPIPPESPYVTTKFAVVGLSQALRVEGAELGVKVSVICPGLVKTPIFETSPMVNIEREAFEEFMEPWQRFGITPQECAGVIMKGVKKNKAVIPVTFLAKLMWYLYRISPGLILKSLQSDLRKLRIRLRGN